MNIYERKWWWKVVLVILAFIIIIITYFYTNKLAREIAIEETKKVEFWADAIFLLPLTTNEDQLRFFDNAVRSNTTIPVILTDQYDNVEAVRNLDTTKICAEDHIERMRFYNEPLELYQTIDINGQPYPLRKKIYYDNSTLYTQLKYYPFVQLGIIGMFLLVGYMVFSSSRKAEQNQVWVGMAKETAHQIGTPLSSIVGWIEILKLQENNEITEVANEINNDVERLNLIADRFSKIGSQPKLEKTDLYKELNETMQYVKRRASDKISFSLDTDKSEYFVNLSANLFDWVIDNILKNALDAMEGKGEVKIAVTDINDMINIELFNSGKAIAKSKWKTIFQPGYSTKKRGWGLGLSLSKRIIETFHKGKIYVKNSKENEGTTFKIELPKAA